MRLVRVPGFVDAGVLGCSGRPFAGVLYLVFVESSRELWLRLYVCDVFDPSECGVRCIEKQSRCSRHFCPATKRPMFTFVPKAVSGAIGGGSAQQGSNGERSAAAELCHPPATRPFALEIRFPQNPRNQAIEEPAAGATRTCTSALLPSLLCSCARIVPASVCAFGLGRRISVSALLTALLPLGRGHFDCAVPAYYLLLLDTVPCTRPLGRCKNIL